MDTIKPLFTATATATGGRNGHSEATDGSVVANYLCPRRWAVRENREQPRPSTSLRAGYAACFGGALDLVAKQHKQDASKAKVTCAVSIGPRDGGGLRACR